MMIVGFEGCIMIYPQEEYKRFIDDEFKDVGIMNPEKSKLMRFIYSRSQPVETDSQGRILLNSELAKLVGIQKKLVTLGVGNRIEVWAEEVHDSHDLAAEAEEANKTLSAKA